jgi:hypothetical protein
MRRHALPIPLGAPSSGPILVAGSTTGQLKSLGGCTEASLAPERVGEAAVDCVENLKVNLIDPAGPELKFIG